VKQVESRADPEEGGDMFLRKGRLTFNGLHGVISQKTELFISSEIFSMSCSLNLLLVSCPLLAYCMFHPEDGVSMFFRNVCELPDYTASHLRTYYSSRG
jgi:hypothetical protein